jgi:signal transduction histidine kinase
MVLQLKHKILFLALGGIAATLVLILLPAAYLLRLSLHDIQRQRLEGEAFSLAEALNGYLGRHRHLVLEMAKDPAIEIYLRKSNEEPLAALFASSRTQFSVMAFVDPSGMELFKFRDGEQDPVLSQVGGEKLFQEAIASPGEVVFSDVERARGGEVVVRFAYALRSFFDEIQGVIMADAPLTRFQPSNRTVRLGEGGYVMIVNKQGRVLVSPWPQTALTPSVFDNEEGRTILAAAESGQSGNAWVELHGQRSFVVYAPTREMGWTAMAVMPFADYRQPLLQARFVIFPVIFITLVTAGWVAVRVSRTLTDPLGRLTRMAGAMAKGDFTVTAPVESQDEVGDLAVSFNRMREELLRSHAVLEEERDKLERIALGGGIGMAVISPDCRVIWSNRVFSEFFGESADAVCLQAFAGQPDRGPKRIFEQKSGQEVFELSQQDAAGVIHWFQVTATPLLNEQGETASAALVFAPITERKRAEMEVMDARKAAEEGDRAKRIFMDTMGHELRTPLTAVLGFSDIMTYMGLSDEQRECVEGIRDSGRALLAIIDDILDLVRIESGGDAQVEREFPLLSILASAAATFRGQAQAQGLALRLEAADDIPARLIGDPVRLRQILLKLLDNAVKFTSAGQVTLRCELVSGEGAGPGTVSLRFAVSDTGPGIPREKLAAIFERFTQADGSFSRQFGGIGVGLSIVHKLVERMGGSMEVDSLVDKGSTFAFTVAFKQPARHLDYRPPGPPRPTVRVLVVDESPLYRMHLRLILEKSGRMALLAESLDQALAAFSRQACDAVLLDVASAGIGLREAVERLRAGAAGQTATGLPVLALVQEPDEQAVRELLAAGFDGVVKKPATLAKLLAAIEAAFRAKGRLAA